MLSNADLIEQYEARRPRRTQRHHRSPQFPGVKSAVAASFPSAFAPPAAPPPVAPPSFRSTIDAAAFPSPIAGAAPGAPFQFPTMLSGSAEFPSMIAPAFAPQPPPPQRPTPAASRRARLAAIEAEHDELVGAVARRAARIQQLEVQLCELFESVYRLEELAVAEPG
jgi:hypothetical protein